MKKRYLIFGSVAFFAFFAKAQTRDSTQQKINRTDVELVYNHYVQSGNNSAVTGGVGTEKLTVYGPAINIERSVGKNAISFNLGADIISSASTDKIDFIASSASSLDARSYLNASYERKFEKQKLSVYAGTGFSIESDYFSTGSKLGFLKESKNKLFTYAAEFLMFNDDLRWGRLNPGSKPLQLIYPFELRTKEWYDTYKRDSYNIKIGFTRVLNKKNIIGLYPELTRQWGLLATPFHRIYFSDNSIAVENLPYERMKAAVALKVNSFVGGKTILKNALNLYSDNFGIVAVAVENETALKIKPFLTLLPNVRFYMQSSSRYFAPYKLHSSDALFYTSDYDLAKNKTYSAGVGIRYSPYQYVNKKMLINTLIFRYSYLYRSNNLSSHVLSLVFHNSCFKTE